MTGRSGGVVPISSSCVHHAWSRLLVIRLTGYLTLKLQGYEN